MRARYEETDPLLPVLQNLWQDGAIQARLYRAFFYARGRGVQIPATVGALRAALVEPETPALAAIPNLGTVGIARLQDLFDAPPGETHAQCASSPPCAADLL